MSSSNTVRLHRVLRSSPEKIYRAFTEASAEDKRRLQLLLSLRLRELTLRPARPLREVMDEIGKNAADRGLTPEILESLMRDE